jgi:hypothetical protein
MKTFCFFLALTFISFISCDNEPVPDSFSFGLENDFKINGEYHSADNSVKFRITEINDSRCPSDVVCIWEGKADVKIQVESPVSGTITLSTYDNPVDTVGNYSFKLIEVLPYPISSKTIKLDEYNVTLKIIELGD